MSTVAAISSYKKEKKTGTATATKKESSKPPVKDGKGDTKTSCYHCGKEIGTIKEHRPVCPARQNTCKACGKTGHFDKCCRNKTVKSIRLSLVRGDDDGPAETVEVDLQCNNCWRQDVTILADSGAEVCAASLAFAESMDYSVTDLEKTSEITTGYDGNQSVPLGILPDVRIAYGGTTIVRAFRIYKELDTPIISWKAAKEAGILSILPKVKLIKKAEHAAAPLVIHSFSEPGTGNGATDQDQGVQVVDRAGGTKALNAATSLAPQVQEHPIPGRETKGKPNKVPRSSRNDPTSKDKTGGKPRLTNIQSCEETTDVVALYEQIFTNPIGIMKGREMAIELTDTATPFACYNPRKIPIPLEVAAKRELDSQVESGIIERIDHATSWVSPLVVAPKKNGDARVCVDLSKLNHYVRRTGHAVKTPREVAASVPQGMEFYSVLDMRKGYHQIRLEESSRDYTAFLTPWGKYRYTTAPQGLLTSGDEFNLRMDEILAGHEGICGRIVDDVLTWGRTREEAKRNLGTLLDRCVEWGAAVCPKKLQFCRPTVEFAGLRISKEGYKASDSMFDAIRDFPVPKSRTDVRSYFGLANQLDANMETLVHLAVLKPLLSEKNAWIWSQDHQQAFEKSKTGICHAVARTYYDPTYRTRLLTDASTVGLGFVLQQREYRGKQLTYEDVANEAMDSREDDPKLWRTVQVGSRHLTDTETRYAVIEWELLGIAWALQKCRVFVTGIPVEVITDHAPLVPIINRHRLDEIENTRCPGRSR